MIGTGSWFDIAASLGALVDSDGRVVPAQFIRDGINYMLVGCDLGNSAIKIVLRQTAVPQLRAFRFETIYTPALTIRAGEGTTALRVLRDGIWREWFWLNQEDATVGEALPIGTTAERLADPRTLDLLIGALVEALHRSGWAPGVYALWLGFGVPNDEVSRTGLVAETRQALRQVRGQQFVVERRDATDTLATWMITFGELVPAAQSLGSFFAWYHTLAGQPAVGDVDLVTIADLGGGHLSRFDVALVRQPGHPIQFRGTGGILGEGMVLIARELIELVKGRYRVRLSETVALHALMTRTVSVGGRRLPIDDLIASAVQTRGQSLLAALTPILADQRRFPLFTGGGSVCLGAELDARAAAAQRAPGSYLIVPASVASTLNAVGLFALARYARNEVASEGDRPARTCGDPGVSACTGRTARPGACRAPARGARGGHAAPRRQRAARRGWGGGSVWDPDRVTLSAAASPTDRARAGFSGSLQRRATDRLDRDAPHVPARAADTGHAPGTGANPCGCGGQRRARGLWRRRTG
jgi:hypothetical protein